MEAYADKKIVFTEEPRTEECRRECGDTLPCTSNCPKEWDCNCECEKHPVPKIDSAVLKSITGGDPFFSRKEAEEEKDEEEFSNSRRHTDEILNMLQQADKKKEHLFILLTGGYCNGKSTVQRMVEKDYKGFWLSDNTSVSPVFNYVLGVYCNFFVDARYWDESKNLIFQRYEYENNAKCLPQMAKLVRIMNSEDGCKGVLMRKLYQAPREITKAHILVTVDPNTYELIKDDRELQRDHVRVMILDYDYSNGSIIATDTSAPSVPRYTMRKPSSITGILTFFASGGETVILIVRN